MGEMCHIPESGNVESEFDLGAEIEHHARYGKHDSSHDNPSDFSLFSIEVKRDQPYKSGGFFDENPSRSKALVGKIILE